jgi:hypothetical protein
MLSSEHQLCAKLCGIHEEEFGNRWLPVGFLLMCILWLTFSKNSCERTGKLMKVAKAGYQNSSSPFPLIWHYLPGKTFTSCPTFSPLSQADCGWRSVGLRRHLPVACLVGLSFWYAASFHHHPHTCTPHEVSSEVTLILNSFFFFLAFSTVLSFGLK